MLGSSQTGQINASAAKHHHTVFQRLSKCESGMKAHRAGAHEIDAVHSMASNYIPGLASTAQIKSMQKRDPDSIWVFEQNGNLKGGIGLLMLNQAGVNALMGGDFDLSAPQLPFLAAPGERPTAIYLWALLARGTAILGLLNLNQQAKVGRLSGADLLATSRTLGGARAMRMFGFSPAAANPTIGIMSRRELV